MRAVSFAIGQRESRLLFQTAPSLEKLSPTTASSEQDEGYRYMNPEEIRAVNSARDERLAPMRAAEAQSRETDIRETLPQIEQQMDRA